MLTYFIKRGLKIVIFNFYFFVFLVACKQKETDPSKEYIARYDYQFDEQGDGLVNFTVDSTFEAFEYRWYFDGSAKAVTTTKPRIQYTFPGNGKYEVKLTYVTKSGESSFSQSIHVTNRLARSFEDLPPDKKDTLRILCVLTHESFTKVFENPATYPTDPYENEVFINFMDRTLHDRAKEFNRFIIQKIVYKLSTEEMNRFNESADPVAFLNYLFVNRDDDLSQKILDQKRKKAASKIAFYLKDPAPGGFSKYGIGGYSVYEGSYFVLFSHGSYVHELAHSFGLAHDTIRGCNYVPIMTGSETLTKDNCNSLWNDRAEFQVEGTVTNMSLLRSPNYYDYAVPAKYQAEFPTGVFVKNMEIRHIGTTPYYRSGIDMVGTIADAFIAQYNISQKRNIANSLDNNPEKPPISSSRSVLPRPAQVVRCQVIK